MPEFAICGGTRHFNALSNDHTNVLTSCFAQQVILWSRLAIRLDKCDIRFPGIPSDNINKTKVHLRKIL